MGMGIGSRPCGVVVGGSENLKGSFYASLIVGMTDTLPGNSFEAEMFAVYAAAGRADLSSTGLFGEGGRVHEQEVTL